MAWTINRRPPEPIYWFEWLDDKEGQFLLQELEAITGCKMHPSRRMPTANDIECGVVFYNYSNEHITWAYREKEWVEFLMLVGTQLTVTDNKM